MSGSMRRLGINLPMSLAKPHSHIAYIFNPSLYIILTDEFEMRT